MNFNKHLELEGKHAFLSPSKYHWINYDTDKLSNAYSKHLATVYGTRMHALASECIKLGVNLPEDGGTLNTYVNDAIFLGLTPEQPLYFSDNCFGTADAISFDGYILRIHDLKTGIMKTSFHQLEVYSAIFCLEYEVNPLDIQIELRLYQNKEVKVQEPDANHILDIMNKIVIFDKQIETMKGGVPDVISNTLRNT